MNHVLELIQQYGDLFYLVTFIWTALEGETFVIFAAFAAQRELLNIELLFLFAGLGSLFGDQVFFFIGRFFGKKVIHRFPKIVPKLQQVFKLIEKHDAPFILSYRFMYGVRNVSALALGMSQITWRRFAFLNLIASFLWSFAFCAGGYIFGDVLERLGLADDDSVQFEVRGIMLAGLGLFVLIVLWRLFMSKKQKAIWGDGEKMGKENKE